MKKIGPRGAACPKFYYEDPSLIFVKNRMKLKELGSRGGARVSSAPLNPPLMTQFLAHPLAVDHI